MQNFLKNLVQILPLKQEAKTLIMDATLQLTKEKCDNSTNYSNLDSAEIKQYENCIKEYESNTQINRLILQNIMYQLKKDHSDTNEIIQLVIDNNTYQSIIKLQSELEYFLKTSKRKDSCGWNHILFLYFKVTYYLTPQRYNKDKYQPSQKHVKELIEFLMQLQEQLDILIKQRCKEFQNQIENANYKEVDYENSYEQQNFIVYFSQLKKYEYSNIFKKLTIEDLKQVSFRGDLLQKEESFFRDVIDCYIMNGNMQLIEYYKAKKSLLYFQIIENFFEEESKSNLIKNYQIQNFKFFDKFDFYTILIDSKIIENLEEDELYLYFLLYSLINLVKIGYIVINKEIKLQKLITKIKTIKNLNSKFKLGYIFILKFMMDTQQKSYLSEENSQFEGSNDEILKKSTICLFKEWANQKYIVSDSYFNKEQLQLYIDGIQSILILAILPEVARFYEKEEQLPYQPTEFKIGYVQQIIRGKRLFLKYPDRTDLNIKYWTSFIQKLKEIIQRQQYERFKSRFSKKNSEIYDQPILKQHNQNFKAFEGQFYFKVCQINLQSLIIMSNSKSSKNYDKQKSELDELVKALVQTIDMCQYYGIYRQRQLYYTLSYLFIDEKGITESIIKLIKQSKIPQLNIEDSQTSQNFILSLKNEFNLETFINKQKQGEHAFFNGTDKFYLCLSADFSLAQKAFENCSDKIEELNQCKQRFEDIISYYGLLGRKKFLTFKINLKIYIKQIELRIELIQKSIQQFNVTEYIKIGKSQFEIYKVSIENQGTFVMKQVPRDELNKKKFVEQQLREISILSMIPQNQYIIQYKGHQSDGQSFQLFLEYFESQNLLEYYQNKLENRKVFNYEKQNRIKIKKLKICIQILHAVEFLHQLNIVHGDIKLSNILISSKKGQRNIKLIDFSESGFMIEDTLGSTPGYEEKNQFKSIYSDYVSIGVSIIRLLYFQEFLYKCDCEDKYKDNQDKEKYIEKCYQSTLHKKQIKEKYKDQFSKHKDDYLQILFKQIMSLFNDQPYLRCSLEELIYLMELQISIFENNDDQFKQQKLFQYKQKYGSVKEKIPLDMINPNDKIKFNNQQQQQVDTENIHDKNNYTMTIATKKEINLQEEKQKSQINDKQLEDNKNQKEISQVLQYNNQIIINSQNTLQQQNEHDVQIHQTQQKENEKNNSIDNQQSTKQYQEYSQSGIKIPQNCKIDEKEESKQNFYKNHQIEYQANNLQIENGNKRVINLEGQLDKLNNYDNQQQNNAIDDQCNNKINKEPHYIKVQIQENAKLERKNPQQQFQQNSYVNIEQKYQAAVILTQDSKKEIINSEDSLLIVDNDTQNLKNIEIEQQFLQNYDNQQQNNAIDDQCNNISNKEPHYYKVQIQENAKLERKNPEQQFQQNSYVNIEQQYQAAVKLIQDSKEEIINFEDSLFIVDNDQKNLQDIQIENFLQQPQKGNQTDIPNSNKNNQVMVTDDQLICNFIDDQQQNRLYVKDDQLLEEDLTVRKNQKNKQFLEQKKLEQQYSKITVEKEINNDCKSQKECNTNLTFKLKDLENYFLQNVEIVESYPRIIQRLQQLNLNMREKQINIRSINYLSNIEKIRFASKIVGNKGFEIFLKDMTQVLQGDIPKLLLDLINQKEIKEEIIDKILKYYMCYEK
ncbi:kinase domain protein (macronuclear) [Tetrahymena thermophila SB210]|uniref:non-specific serine/threonine protein kinase n=1 Tax=Tetrahymena thermophila (strain SB210) TaxID=312017 RepID=I7LWQ8_TETTS|nr:kinase domain protein [Tetrahymena thermophila SB210]EAS02672.2 kinase domain protein [Tetrahymena thermophila SB210]|eukprot:XP_001022917.2 kinase domain protein [Tetrahymena thermophila SB210]